MANLKDLLKTSNPITDVTEETKPFVTLDSLKAADKKVEPIVSKNTIQPTKASRVTTTYDGSGSVNQSDYSVIQKTNSTQLTTISGIERMLRMQGIYTDMMYDKYQRFKRTNIIDVSEDLLRGTKEYIFITKPELNIYKDSTGTILNPDFALQPMFKDVHDRHPRILRQLQYNIKSHESPFINLLSYAVLNTADLSDTNSREIVTAQNIYGTKITYRSHSIESDQDQSFTLEFRENNIAEIYTFFRLWDKYATLKALGIVDPPSSAYTQKRILHDKVAAYKIVTTDMDDILFYAKWYGVFPDNAPRSGFSEVGNDGISHSVTFKADFVEDMDPQILEDFNELVQPYKAKCKFDTSKAYINDEMRMNNEVQIVPYIVKYKNGYKLKWLGGSV